MIMSLNEMRGNRTLIMTAIVTVTFLIAIEGTVLNTALPIIVSELGGWKLMSWAVSVYLLSTAIITPIAGKAADRVGRKKVFMIGTMTFLIASALCGISSNMEMLIVYRALQGLGAGCILPITYTIVADIYPFQERAKAQSLLSAAWGVSAVASPFTGGIIVDMFSWRWIFFINIPFGIIAMVLLGHCFFEQINKQKGKIDGVGALVFSLSLSCLMLAIFIADSPDATIASWVLWSLLSGFVVGLLVFIVIELKAEDPLIDIRLFKQPIILLPNIGDFLLHTILVAINFYIPLWMQGIHGYGASQSGLILLSMSVSWPIAANRCSVLIEKWGMRNTSIFGALLAVFATLGLAMPAWRDNPILLVSSLLVLGLGFGLVFTVHIVSIQSAVGWERRGSAVATNNFIRQIGQVIGITLFGYLLSGNIRRFSESLDGEASNAIINTDITQLFGEQSEKLSMEMLAVMQDALRTGLGPVFIILSLLAAAACVAASCYPKKQRFAIERDKEIDVDIKDQTMSRSPKGLSG